MRSKRVAIIAVQERKECRQRRVRTFPGYIYSGATANGKLSENDRFSRQEEAKPYGTALKRKIIPPQGIFTPERGSSQHPAALFNLLNYNPAHSIVSTVCFKANAISVILICWEINSVYLEWLYVYIFFAKLILNRFTFPYLDQIIHTVSCKIH